MFSLLENFLKKKINKLNKNGIKVKFIGEKKFTPKLNKLLIKSEKITSKNKSLQVNLALNYGSRSELINALKLLVKQKQKVTEKNISSNLYTRNIPDPDLLIRTGNTRRLSNFLLWQLSYSEIYFSNKFWPEFTEKDYNKIINNFKKIKRNFGKI